MICLGVVGESGSFVLFLKLISPAQALLGGRSSTPQGRLSSVARLADLVCMLHHRAPVH